MDNNFIVLLYTQNPYTGNLLKTRINNIGFCCFLVNNIKAFWKTFYRSYVDLVIIDINNEVEAINIYKIINLTSKSFVLFLLRNRGFINSQINGLGTFLEKPFTFTNFDKQILSVFRLKEIFLFFHFLKKEKIIFIYPDKLELKIDSEIIKLTNIEFKIFNLLISSKKQICTKSNILKNVWDYNEFWFFESNIIEMHISKLRKKFTKVSKKEVFIKKKYGCFSFIKDFN